MLPKDQTIHDDGWCTPAQREIFNDLHRFRIVVAGRRFGKTYLATHELIRACFSMRDATIVYVGPTREKSKELGWTQFLEWVDPKYLESKNENELRLKIKGLNNRLLAKGSDNADSCLGLGIDLVVMDEAATIDEKVWKQIIRPALADKQGEAFFISTPRGFNWFYRLWREADSGEAGPEWRAWQYTTIQGGNVPEAELAQARREMHPSQFAQEFEASFSELGNRVYSNFKRDLHIDQSIEDNGGPLHIGVDFNVDPMSACIAIEKGEMILVFDEIVIPNGNTEELCSEIHNRYADRDITVYPDPSGKARSTAADLNSTNHTILRDHGFDVITPQRAPFISDRVNEVQAVLMNAEGEKRLMFHPRCKECIECMEGQTYKEGTSIPDKSGGLDHMADAIGYMIHSMRPIQTGGFMRRKFII